jgi:hypothetical protein
MDLQKVLGFPLDQVRLDPDGTSTPPEVSPLAPPTKPRQRAPEPAAPEQGRQFQATRIEGLEAPPPPPPPPPAPPARTPAAPLAALPAQPLPAEPLPAQPAPARQPPATAPALTAAAPLVRTRRGAAEPSPLAELASWLRELSAPGELGQRWGLLALGSALLGFGAAVLVALLVRSSGKAEPAPSRPRAPAPVATPAAPAPLREACVRQREPSPLLRGVSSTLPLEARALPGGAEVLLGLASSNGTALGLRVNATTLASSELLRESGSRELLGVVPQPAAQPSFAVDRASVGGYREWRTLPDRPDLALARTNRALHLIERGSQRERALWPLAAEEELSRPRLEWQDAGQLALVLRRGGRQGKLVLGWLQPERGERSTLRELPFAGSELGLPSLATHGDVALVAAAVRESASAPWQVELTSSTRQGSSRRHELPSVAAERESFAPSVSALPGARWFLQWTEGEQGLRRVRGVTLDARFALLGEPIALSSPDTSAGSGSLVAVDEGLLSLFLVQRGSSYELWATTLSCR